MLRIWVPLILVLGTILWLLYRTELHAQQKLTQSDEQHTIGVASQVLTGELGMLNTDLRYLSELSSLKTWLDTGNRTDKIALSHDFLNFVRTRGLYDQVRFRAVHAVHRSGSTA